MGSVESGTSWDECWALHGEMEASWNHDITVRLWPARRDAKGKWWQAVVAVTIELRQHDRVRPITRRCQHGGTHGARTMPAALHRALSELYWALEEIKDEAAAQAAF